MRFTNIQRKYSRPRTREDEDKVQNGLAMTPADMQRLVSQGVPVSVNNLGLDYFEGGKEIDFEPLPQYRRGVDIADLWENDQRLKQKMRDGLKRHKYIYPNGEPTNKEE